MDSINPCGERTMDDPERQAYNIRLVHVLWNAIAVRTQIAIITEFREIQYPYVNYYRPLQMKAIRALQDEAERRISAQKTVRAPKYMVR